MAGKSARALGAEMARLAEARDSILWIRRGPHLRGGWGTVREDCRENGYASNSRRRDQARSRRGPGTATTLFWTAEEITCRLAGIFRGRERRQPFYSGSQKHQQDPHWHELILFHEYRHGDNAASAPAIKTGCTGIITRPMHLSGAADQFLEVGKAAAIVETEPT